MNGRFAFRILAAFVLLAGLAGVAIYSYNLGIAQGVARSGELPTAPAGFVPYPHFAGPFFFGPFGFAALFCLIPLLFFILPGIVFRGLFWRGAWHWGGHPGHWEKGVPPRFEEWHRKAHESTATEE